MKARGGRPAGLLLSLLSRKAALHYPGRWLDYSKEAVEDDLFVQCRRREEELHAGTGAAAVATAAAAPTTTYNLAKPLLKLYVPQ
jgi:hypothetical protein